MEDTWTARERETQQRIAALEQQLRSEKEGFLGELREWMVVLEDARKKLATAECERDREKMLRGMLLEQQSDEARLQEKLMLEKHSSTTQKLRERIDTLERACRRSAAVIAELREALHRANKTATEKATAAPETDDA
ncbi:hypothetical protein DQ04_00411000 [Trypanosoma grayi]|uniref:hypothetical protein n=1 Tax=Trypanosoma grayi TaxID=71804 RepID=UPI0004F494DE|nr:hypothetical protein DQ04_00411000 [Trypanosoma grayi]KEG14536.1 hypothetical protein DQ04_00411000 [Trypanosoma grayi]